MKPFGALEVWFFTGSQDLYGEAALEQVARDSAEIVAALDAAPGIPVHIVSRPVLRSAEGIAAAIAEANASDRCIGLIAWMHTFSPARMWIGGLQSLGVPLLHLHTQFNRDLPWADIDMDFMNLHQAAHGDREFAFIESRLRVARKTVAGHWQDPYVHDRIAAWARAAAGWHEARHLRIARFGDNMRRVADTEGDKVEAQSASGSPSTAIRWRSWSTRSRPRRPATSTHSSTRTTRRTGWHRSWPPTAPRRAEFAKRHASRSGFARS